MVLLLAFVLIRESGIAGQEGRERENKNGIELLFLSAGKESDYRFACGGCVCACYGGAGGGGGDFSGEGSYQDYDYAGERPGASKI